MIKIGFVKKLDVKLSIWILAYHKIFDVQQINTMGWLLIELHIRHRFISVPFYTSCQRTSKPGQIQMSQIISILTQLCLDEFKTGPVMGRKQDSPKITPVYSSEILLVTQCNSVLFCESPVKEKLAMRKVHAVSRRSHPPKLRMPESWQHVHLPQTPKENTPWRVRQCLSRVRFFSVPKYAFTPQV